MNYHTAMLLVDELQPKLTHYLFEGLAVDTLGDKIKHLVSKGFITLSSLNEKIETFEYSKIGIKNKPQPAKLFCRW